MDFSLSEAAESFRAEFAGWLATSLPAQWRDLSAEHAGSPAGVQVRRAWARRLFEAGYAGPTWPTEHGGMGLTVDEQFVYLSELVTAGAPDVLNNNAIGVFGPCLMRYGSPAQRERYLAPLLSNDEVWCQGFSEPDAGSDLANLGTRAVREGDCFRISGQKVWTTNATHADYCYLLARTGAPGGRTSGVTMFVLDMASAGVTARPLRNITGADDFSEVFLDEVEVSIHDVVGEIGQGWEIAMFALSQERTSAVAYRALRMRRDLVRIVELVRSRFGAEVAADPATAIGRDLADLVATARMVDALVSRNLAVIASGRDVGVYSPMVILTWSQATQRLHELAMRVVGPDGLDLGGPDGHWFNSMLFARSATIAGGTSEIQRNIIAKTLGLPSGRG